MASTSRVVPSRSFRYMVWPLSRWPEPGMTFTVVMPPARARMIEALRRLRLSETRTSGWMGAELSAPSALPTWLWLSTRPGMMTLPRASRRWAPAGMAVSGPPRASTLPPCTTRTPSRISGPSTGMIRAPMKAWACSWACREDSATRVNAYSSLVMGSSTGSLASPGGGEGVHLACSDIFSLRHPPAGHVEVLFVIRPPFEGTAFPVA